jgi:SAM-dependent methyltransferase
MDAHMVGKGPRELSLDDYGRALIAGEFNASYPSDEVQSNWTGCSGWETMRQALQFLRVVEAGYSRMTGKSLTDASILDFGCGWGRMLRLLPHYTDKIYGCDPWDVSLQHCDVHNVPGKRVISDPLSDTLPFADIKFDLAYAYSVFTHTDHAATIYGLKSIRNSMVPGGIGVFTIRPVEYWNVPAPDRSEVDTERLVQMHETVGFAHFPHGRANYGDTSMTFEGLTALAPGWEFDHYDREFSDPRQLIVFMRAV